MTGARDPSRRAGTGALVLAGLFACGSDPQTTPPASPVTSPSLRSQQSHSSSLAASPDGSLLFVVHPDADSVSILRV
ncbi:MAG TPA: hypothetical protein VK762_12845, partial [Polyangiaceae bacterium]|nr:hypothetical protein [Polyangiaceae bacterium]